MSEKITEGNKLIAELIGLKIRYTQSPGWDGEQGDWDMEIDCPDSFDHDEQLMFLYDESEPEYHFKFHKSWDWLKPAIMKVYEFALANPEQVAKIKNMSIVVDIKPAWEAVVEFAKWHKAQTPPANNPSREPGFN